MCFVLEVIKLKVLDRQERELECFSSKNQSFDSDLFQVKTD
jgi:hypothetical protein